MTYSTEHLTVTWQGLNLTAGLVKGSTILETRNARPWTQRTTAIRSYNPDKTGTVTLRLKTASTEHHQLQALANASRTIVGPLITYDAVTRVECIYKNAYTATRLDEGFGGADFPWMFGFERLTINGDSRGTGALDGLNPLALGVLPSGLPGPGPEIWTMTNHERTCQEYRDGLRTPSTPSQLAVAYRMAVSAVRIARPNPEEVASMLEQWAEVQEAIAHRAASVSNVPTLADVEAAEQSAKAEAARAQQLRARLQLDCKHTDTLEAEHVVGHGAPFRVCVRCGLAEESWACGHSILPSPPSRTVPRGEARRHVVGRVHENPQFVRHVDDFSCGRGCAEWLRAKLAEVLGLGEVS